MQNHLDHALRCWFRLTYRYSVQVIILIIVLAGVSLAYTWNNLGMNTDTRDMLSPELRWRQLDLEYENLFPHTIDNLLIVIEAATPDQASDAAAELYRLLQQDKKHFKSVFSYGQLDFIKGSALLFLEPAELQDLADQLAANQAFLARLIADQNLRGLAGMLEEALEAVADGEDVDLEDILHRLTTALDANRNGQPYHLSWQKLLFDETEKSVYREFIVVQPLLDYTEMLPAAQLLDMIPRLANENGITDRYKIRLRFTDSVALSHEELESVMQTNTLAIIIAFVFVAVILTLGLGSGWLVLATLLTLVSGLILTAGFAALTVGELNLISVAFAVLYIGLGVDFAIHYCLKYREQLALEPSRSGALENTSTGIGSALIICAFTTAIGFYAFMPTDYDGVAELGWISGSGMFISLVITLTFMPALLRHLPVRPGQNRNGNGFIALLSNIPARHGLAIKWLAVVLTVFSLYLVKDLEFDSNTLNLQPPQNESVKTFKDLMQEPDAAPLTGKVIARDIDDAKHIKQSLEKLSLVDKVAWLHDFIPEDQEEKLLLIDEINLLLGAEFFSGTEVPVGTRTRLTALQQLLDKTRQYQELDVSGLRDFQTALAGYLAHIESRPAPQQAARLETLERGLLDSLPGRLRALQTGLETSGVDVSDLPPELVQRWMSNGRYLIEVYPREDLQENAAQSRFVEQVQAAEPRVTGGPIVTVEAGNAVIQAFSQAFISAIVVITLLLLLLMPTRVDVLYVLAPLLLAALLTAAISVMAGIPLNFANIIALPLLLGIGVDSAIHMIHRHRTGAGRDRLLTTSSSRAIFISALTTIGSIGNLAFSPHVGTASMGILLTIGISMALLTTLFILPSLLEYNKQ